MTNQPTPTTDAIVDTLMRELRTELLKTVAAAGQGYAGSTLVMASDTLGLLLVFHPKLAKTMLMACSHAIGKLLTERHGTPEVDATRCVEVKIEPDTNPNQRN